MWPVNPLNGYMDSPVSWYLSAYPNDLLEFKSLTPEQAWSMFCAETGFDADADPQLTVKFKQQLSAIADLAPGDFATVKRQANMLDEQLSPSGWLEQLKAEANAKMAGLRRQKLGFAA